MTDFTEEQIALLAKQERLMDSGKVPHVVYNEERVAVTPEVMERLGLEAGQTISHVILLAILRLNVTICERETMLDEGATND